ncbi:hypothetical protein MTBLM5_30191 [Magnetospirillum sp. LM-5]|uniref:hypothetical protein n=1 Tax=Magnetospirillum sp. LM-5 TaxID=2681466 RepID=UPI001385E2B8|nr:hypothetical protein [Magnetospirillum sp. LM-5]CAA7619531.1 hypothetical protein MTBLM5_30191 [Magnetospirillum sp. LM-5]
MRRIEIDISTGQARDVPLTVEEITAIELARSIDQSIAAKAAILRDIADIEATITNRRLRDAILTPEGRDWLMATDRAIDLLRRRLANGN